MKKLYFIFVFVALVFSTASFAQESNILVDISKVNPNIKVEMRYFSNWNFLGRIVNGYEANVCLLTKEAANALSNVQKAVEAQGFSLLVFDCYRPQRAVNDFLKWVKDDADQKMKPLFYPDQPKNKLVERDYIADKSSHSRGSTVDLTLVKKDAPTVTKLDRLLFQEDAVDCRFQKNISTTGQVDMGTSFDCFSEYAHTESNKVSEKATKNRLFLRTAMQKAGFVNFSKEWWHYTLKNEPFKEKPFDFVVK